MFEVGNQLKITRPKDKVTEPERLDQLKIINNGTEILPLSEQGYLKSNFPDIYKKLCYSNFRPNVMSYTVSTGRIETKFPGVYFLFRDDGIIRDLNDVIENNEWQKYESNVRETDRTLPHKHIVLVRKLENGYYGLITIDNEPKKAYIMKRLNSDLNIPARTEKLRSTYIVTPTGCILSTRGATFSKRGDMDEFYRIAGNLIRSAASSTK